jgi:hypothetical protein
MYYLERPEAMNGFEISPYLSKFLNNHGLGSWPVGTYIALLASSLSENFLTVARKRGLKMSSKLEKIYSVMPVSLQNVALSYTGWQLG